MYNYVDLRSKYIEEIDVLKDEIENLRKTEEKLRNSEKNDFLRNSEKNENLRNSEKKPIFDEEKTRVLTEKEKERKSRISSFFSKKTLNKMVQEMQSSQLIRKKASLYSEKAIEDYKKINEDLKTENKRLMELVERVRAETNKNKEFIINNIRELEKRHQVQIEKK